MLGNYIMNVSVRNTLLDYPTELGKLHDCNALLQDEVCLRERMAEDGYLLIRGLDPRCEVRTAREAIPAMPEENEQDDGQRRCIQEIARCPEVIAVLKSSRMLVFFGNNFGVP